MLFQRLALTNIGHLSHSRIVRAVKELWRIVIDVLHLDNELWGRLQGFVGVSSYSLGGQCVLGLFFSVQSLCGMNVASFVINDKNSACPLSRKDVFNVSISWIYIRMKLEGEKERFGWEVFNSNEKVK